VTAQGSPLTRFKRALNARNVLLAELALGELEKVPLDVALQMVHLYAEKADRKFEPAARKWLSRWITEEQPSVETIAATACTLFEASQRGHSHLLGE
jgi:hypothetical protein